VLEILLLVGLCKWMGSIMRGKGRNPLLLQILTVMSWFGGLIAGAIAGAVYSLVNNPNQDPEVLTLYLFALPFGALSVGIIFAIAFILPPVQQTPQYYSQGNTFSPPIDPNNPYQSP